MAEAAGSSWGRRLFAAGLKLAPGRDGLGPKGLVAMACALAFTPGFSLGGGRGFVAGAVVETPLTQALRARLAEAADPTLTTAYAQRGFRPLWVDAAGPMPAAHVLALRLAEARDEGLDPADYDAAAIGHAIRRNRTPGQLADLELTLSRAYAGYAADLRAPPAAAKLTATDPAVAQPSAPRRWALNAAARSPDLLRFIQTLTPTNPVYQGLRAALVAHRRGKPASAAFDSTERALALNLARARALPSNTEDRFVLVDAGAAQLWLYERGRPVLTMPVAVGTVRDPTPLMAGMIRYAAYHPYWYVPPDMARDHYAPEVLAGGPQVLAAQGLEVLSGWTDQARVIDPATVDWRAVAEGRELVRLRQRPGADNMMGAVKLMLPNSLGIYLHDTPNHGVFAQASRNFSHGCVRLADAQALAKALGAPPPADASAAEARVDLPAPVPVYIAYFTTRVTEGEQVALAPDVYSRDGPLMASLASRRHSTDAIQLATR